MKYLKTYEEKFSIPKRYWWEGTEECTEEQAIDIIKGLKGYSYQYDFKIKRNVAGLPDILLIDPKQFERKSANTDNYYTLIIDNSDKWKDFPKRSQSLICLLTNKKSYDDLGVYNYYVIPLGDSRWGWSNTFDFWDAFRFGANIDSLEDLSDINRRINNIAKAFDIKIDDTNIDTLKKSFSEIDIELNKIRDDYEQRDNLLNKINYYTDSINYIIDNTKNIGIYEWYYKILDPTKNGIECLNYPEMQDKQETHQQNIEVWTDSKCLLIKYDVLEKIKGLFPRK